MRLSLALSQGLVALPDAGRVLLLRPPGDLDTGSLPVDRCVAVTGFRPDHDALAARGVPVARVPEGDFAAAIVFVPRVRDHARAMIAQACGTLPPGAPVIVDGAKGDGIDSLLRACRGWADIGEVYSKAHGKCFAFPATRAPADWPGAERRVEGYVTRPGVFSADGPDPGSVMLSDALPALAGRVCDLGAGWGYLSARLLTSEAVTGLDLVEAEALALDCARANVPDPRAAFHWADATVWTGGPYDAIVCNPPFHASRKADPALGRAFIAAAARNLAPKGAAWFVANRHLPYEASLSDAFAQVVTRAEGAGYKVIEARRPRGTRR